MKINVQWRRRVLLILLAIVVAAGLFVGFRPQPVEVDTGVAHRAALQVTVEQEGRTRVVERYVVMAPVNGYARRIDFEVGDAVERGTVLAELEPTRADVLDMRRQAEAQSRIAAASSNVSAAAQRVAAAASSAEVADKELQRMRALREAGHVSAAAEDRAAAEAQRTAADLRSAQFAATTARHELEAARTALKYAASGANTSPVQVRSPAAGRVLRIVHKSEGAVAAGQPLIEIGNPRALEVEVDVLSADAVRIHPGTRVEFERWGGPGTLRGVVRVIEPEAFTKVSALGVEEQRVWVIADFTSPPGQWQRLGDGYRVEAVFILSDQPDVLQIPASALFRDGDGWAAFVIDGGRAVKRKVSVGQRNALAAQIVSGIAPGERVIVHPDDRIRDGVRVEPR